MSFCATLAATALPAAADVSPDDVWAALRAQLQIYGQLKADETRRGDTLVISNIVLRTVQDAASSTITMAEPIIFRPLSGGRVAVDMPPRLTTSTEIALKGGKPAQHSYAFTQTGMVIEASGTPDNILHSFSAPRMTYEFRDFDVKGRKFAGYINLILSASEGSWRSSGENLNTHDAAYTVGALSVQAELEAATDRDAIKLNTQFNGLDIDTSYILPERVVELPLAELRRSDFFVDSDLAFTDGSFDIAVTANGSTTNLQGRTGGGAIDIAIDNAKVSYGTELSDLAAKGRLSNLPFPPIELSYDRSRVDLAMPHSKTDMPEDFGLGLVLEGVKVSDFLWAMVDPEGRLPRDAADMVLNLNGAGNWLVDFSDLAAARGEGKAVGALEALNLALRVKAAGAELTGDGDFTFDNSDVTTFNGLPRPMGALNLALSGGMTLLDNLAALGLVTDQRAVGIRMMSGLFAKPGPEPDTLTSTILIDPSGKVSANGIPLR
jgi:hypothetical protein